MNDSPLPAPASVTRTRTCHALIMAGGRSERMHATAGLHKFFVTVHGRRLIDRNLQTLFENGFQDVTIAVGAHSLDMEEYLSTGPGHAMSCDAGARLTILRETVPLGTIGAARMACADADPLLVVNVDNLTTLPLRAMVEFHHQADADFTIATHQQPFQIPFGQLVLHAGHIIEYREKPTLPVSISSGVYVLGRRALRIIDADRRVDIPDLFAAARRHGLKIRAFEHACTWVDVNDAKDRIWAERQFTE